VSESPLREATITELFGLPPEELSDAQFERIIAEFRAERHTWNKTEEVKRAAPKKGQPKITAVNLDDIII
jgi:hypothetical protein